MGNKQGSLANHLETASKTGALAFPNKKLEEFPEALQKVTGNLRNLDLSTNKITIIPIWISDFKSLKIININGNQLMNLPEEIGNLVKLETLLISGNLLKNLPKSLGKLNNLKEIDASRNHIQEFPIELSMLKRLDLIDLNENKIKVIPDGVEDLQITELSLNQNQISVISPALAKCPRLKTLRLEKNCLTVEAIPTVLFTESNVSTLNLKGNLFNRKQLIESDGFEKYMERYTAVRRKLD